MLYEVPADYIAMIVIVVASILRAVSWRKSYHEQSRLLHDESIESASFQMASNTWRQAHGRCEEARKRMSHQMMVLEEGRMELREQAKAKENLIDQLEGEIDILRNDIQDLSASVTIEKEVSRRLGEMQHTIDVARGNGAGEQKRDAELAAKIDDVYSFDELKRVMQFMDVNPGEIPGKTLPQVALEFVSHLRRRNRLEELLNWLRAERGHVRWTW